MLGEKGFNEIDMALFKHLLFNKRPVAFIRTQCDSAIVGIQDEPEMKVPIILQNFFLIYNFRVKN